MAFPFHFYPQFLLMHRFPPDKDLPVVENVEKRAFMHKELWKSRNLPHFYVVSYLNCSTFATWCFIKKQDVDLVVY